MSGWIVYSKDGSLERCKLRSLEYGGTAMGERAVTATFDYHSEVSFEVFDYIEYRGERFELEAVPTVKKLSSFEYQYELRFVSLKYELERCEMRDLVPSDNGVVYPTPLTFSFTGDVRYLTDRIQACLDAMYGAGVWKITIAEGTSSEEKNITIAQQNCWNALALVNSTYGLNFYIKGRTITIGGEQPLVNHTFEYGKGNGLYEIERASDTETGIVTKLRAYGSTRNLDYSYPKKPEWSDSVLPVSFALSPLRLMLPSFKTDGKTDFVLADDAAIAKYGIREASMVYDDIYPSIAGATYNGQAIDEIKAVDAVNESQKTFVVYLHELGFDLEEHLTTSDAQISMKSGALQGYTFTISSIEKQTDGYKITLGKNSLENSEESGAYVPGVNWNMKAGDKFVLLNILMPQKYIRDAENRLLARANEYLSQYSKTNFSYNIGLHDKFLIQNPSVYDSLIEGSKLKVYDKEIGIDEEVTIQSITITENLEDNILPQVKVTLNNEPSASTLDRIQGKLNEVAAETAANGFTTQSEIMAQYRRKLDKPFFDKLFVAIDANGNEIPSTDVITPIAYIKAKYHVASVGGFTMYAMDKDLDVPSLASGLPFDGRTIWYNPETNQIEVIGGTGGGSGEGVSNFWDLSGIPSWITNSKPKYSYSEIEGTPDLSGYATQTWVKNQGYLTQHQDLSGYQPLITSSNKLAYSLISGTPTSLKNPNALSFGSKSYDGSAKITLTAGDLGALTSHQTIYTLTFASGTFASGSFIANSANKTINVPTTTSHISEGSNLYFTNTRAINALAETLKAYVTLGGTETITGEKNFTGGLKVNGSPIYYDTERKYWKLEGDLLVTGGVTMYGSDSSFTPSTIMDAIVVDNVTIIKQDGKLVALGGGSSGGGLADAVAWGNILGKPSWITDTTPSISISGTSVSLGGSITQSALRTALGLGSNAYTSTAYLPLSGGMLKGIGADFFQVNRTDGNPVISYYYNGSWLGRMGYNTKGSPVAQIGSDYQFLLHSGNYSNYALPLSGGTLTSSGNPLTIKRTDNSGPGLVFYSKDTQLGSIGIGTDYVPKFYNANVGTFYTMWHNGNDGSGSGMDADLLDGYHRKNWNGIPTVLSNGVMDIGKYIDFHNASDDGLDYAIRLECQGAYNNWVYLPSKTGTLALTIDNVASATKLQTARTIWGQSFDGTGNVSGNVKGSYFTIGDRDNAYIELLGGTNYGYVQMLADGSMAVGSNTSSSIIVNKNGNVGIGTTTPSSKLHVSGDITASGTLSSVGLFANDGTIILKNSANGSGLLVYPGIDESTAARFEIRTNNAWARTGFTLFTNGNFTIGTSNDQGYRFFVAGDTKVQGNILATGGITTNDFVTINGIKLSKSKDGVLYLDGNLVVKGGVTMYGTDATSSPSILDSLPIASTSSKGIAQFNPSDFAVKDGVVSFVGSVDGGVASSVAWGNITGKPTFATVATSGKYSDLSGLPTIPTIPSSLKNPYSLTINNSGGTAQVTYDGSAAKSLSLTKAMVGLGNVENTALSTWAGTNKITTLGTITSGTWNGSKIVNAYLANSSVTISGELVSLGGSITQSALRSALGLGSNAYTSTAYLPLSGGTMGGNIVFQGGYLRFTNSSGSFLGAYNVNDSGDALYLKGSAWNKILHSGNYSEYALPLSGGTLSGNLTIQNTSVDIITLHRASNSGSPSIKFTNKSDGTLGYMGVSDSSRGLQPFFMDTGSSVFKIWHEGNDGSGSGLDADLLDGYHRKNWNGIPTVLSNGVMDIGKYIDFHNAADDAIDYATRLECSGAHGNWVYLPSKTGTLALTIDTVASANSVMINYTQSNVDYEVLLTNPKDSWVSGIDALYHSQSKPLTYNASTGLLKVGGGILATGGITMYSMRALKNVVDERGLSLNELSTIKPTRYTWKDGRDNRLHFGGIADDIQQVLPEVVYKTSDGILTMDYGNAAFAVASSLIKPVVDHEKRIAMLEAENKQLRQEVERLKSA